MRREATRSGARRASSRRAGGAGRAAPRWPAIAAVAAGGEVDAGRAPGRRDRQADRLRARACPTPAATTRWCPPTAGRWRGWSGRWRRRRSRVPGPARACRWSRSTSAAAAARAAPSPPARHLTASGRRTTAFTQVDDRRRSLGWVEVDLLALPARASAGSGSSAAPPQADVEAAAGTPRPARGRPDPGPARDPARPQPLRVPGRRTSRPGSGSVAGRYPGWSS